MAEEGFTPMVLKAPYEMISEELMGALEEIMGFNMVDFKEGMCDGYQFDGLFAELAEDGVVFILEEKDADRFYDIEYFFEGEVPFDSEIVFESEDGVSYIIVRHHRVDFDIEYEVAGGEREQFLTKSEIMEIKEESSSAEEFMEEVLNSFRDVASIKTIANSKAECPECGKGHFNCLPVKDVVPKNKEIICIKCLFEKVDDERYSVADVLELMFTNKTKHE